MTERGLKGVSNPSAIFLSTHASAVPGSCVLVTLEARGRCWWRSGAGRQRRPSPRRLSVGLDRDRLAMLLAVLHRHAGVDSLDQDVFINAVGGVRISEPAADLAVLLAIQGGLRGKALPPLHRLRRSGPGRRGARPRRVARAAEGAASGLLGGAGAQGQCAEEADRGLTIHAVERVDGPSTWCDTWADPRCAPGAAVLESPHPQRISRRSRT